MIQTPPRPLTFSSPNQFTLTPTRPPTFSNIVLRPSSGSFSAPPAAFQKVQELPEVKKAREEAGEAQKRYFDAMKKAMESGKRQGASGKGTEGSSQPAVASGQTKP